MKRNQLMALSLISAAAALGIGGAAATLRTDLPAEARSALVTLAASTDWHGPIAVTVGPMATSSDAPSA